MSDKIVLKRQGNLVQIQPCEPVMSILTGEFVFRRLVDATNKFGQRIGRRPGPAEKLYQLESDSRAVISAGMCNRLVARMTELGIAYDYQDLRSKVWPEPDYENIFNHGFRLRPGQSEMIAKLATCDMGRFQNPTASGKSWIITMSVLLWPNSNILIITDGLSVFDGLYRRLMKVTPDVGRVGGGRCDIQRVTLVNKDSLHKLPLDECDLALVDECHTMATSSVAPKFSGLCNAKIFGFSATNTGRGDQSDILSEAMFGPIIHNTPYQVAQASGAISAVRVWMYHCGWKGPNTDGIKQATTRKRHAYWRHDKRNELIAHVARNILPDNEQQLIMVDTIEHALRLRKLLPEWTAVYRPKSNKDGMSVFLDAKLIREDELLTRKSLEQIEVEFEEGRLLKVIANSVWHKAVDFPQLKYLIRAEAAPGEIACTQIGGRLSRLHGDNIKYLIDFYDEFDRICGDRAMQRLRIYKKLGWPIENRVAVIPTQPGISVT